MLLSLEFRRAIAVLAVDELIASGRREEDALATVAETPAGTAFAGTDMKGRVDALRRYKAELEAAAVVEQPTRPLEIARFHYNQTRSRLRAIGRDHGKSAETLLNAVDPLPSG